MSYKKFAMILTGIVVTIFLCNVALWHFGTSRVFFAGQDGNGDLRRLASYAIPEPATRAKEYGRKHTEFSEYLKGKAEGPFDIITIGDSFTNGGGGSWYQDNLEEKYGVRVLNIPMDYYPQGNALSLLYLLCKEGYLEKLQPKAVVIGAAGHYTDRRYGRELIEMPADALDIADTKKEVQDTNLTEVYRAESALAPALMVRSNLEYLKNKYYALCHGKYLSQLVFVDKLDRKLFSTETDGDRLFCISEDMHFAEEKENPLRIHENMEQAAALLKKYQCTLVFLPSVDKYDLYYPYIENPSTEENPLLDTLDSYPKNYIYINSKKILRPLLENGEQDVYWNQDTHYSYKAQEAAADAMMKMLKIK